ncbi:Peptidyl-prolyl cis-trans isomerase FKBP4 [Hypsibius exemplaris]|uniref:peptidylprolyl isomerase n=1 Tax=Hypsibius exemplaris TaxID=2072580 RepID=A0A9X6NHF2_HYPEX|nr:Peptidyl-prolyl cis-trans isomerase FKBP4 [Hypsibius exemplaris]
MSDSAEPDKLPVDFQLTDPDLVDCTETKDRGCLKKVLTPGSGDESPFAGATVTVHYTGRLLDGSVFDSSRTRGEPFTFELGRRRVIKGWDVGVATMKKGELAELVCSPEYAYGKSGSGDKIPPDSTLVFQVELLAWEDEDISLEKNKKIYRKVIHPGTGFSCPKEGSKCTVKIIGKRGDKVFDERQVDFTVGEAEESGLIIGFDAAVLKMKLAENSIITFHSDQAFGKAGKPEWGIPPDAEVKYDVTLVSFEKAKETWSMSVDEKLEAAEQAKEKGTEYFTKGHLKSAAKLYERMKDCLGGDPEFKGEKEEKRVKMMIISHLNLAMTFLKQNDFYAAQKAADEAIKLDPANIKAIYRHGMALYGVKDYEQAQKDFKKVLQLEPANKAASQQLALCAKEIKAYLDREKKVFGGMFASKPPAVKKSTGSSDEKTVLQTETTKSGENVSNGDKKSGPDAEGDLQDVAMA